MNIKSIKAMNLFCLMFFILFASVKPDLPIHCLVSDIQGNWIFSIDNKHFDPSLNDKQTTCGRGFPGKVEKNIGDKDYYLFEGSEKITLELRANYKVYENGELAGTWTMVYDQSFLIYYHNSIITSSFKYYKKTINDFEFTYDCGKTMVGWIIWDKNDLHSNWSCFHAKKEGRSKKGIMSLIQTQMTTQNTKKSFVQLKKPKSIDTQIKYEQLEPMVKQINAAGLTWKAEVYSNYKGMSLFEMRNSLGLNKKMAYHSEDKQSIEDKSQNHFFYGKKLNKRKQEYISMIQTKSNTRYYDSYSDFLIDFNTPDEEDDYMIDSKKRIEQIGSIEGTTLLQSKSTTNSITTNKSERERDSSEVTDFNEMTKYIDTPVEQIDENKIAKNWDWRNVGGIDYIGEANSQGGCGACYVFATVRSLQSRLRIKTHNKDKTEFSIQFPISCNFYSEGCQGGFPILLAKFLSEFEIVPKDCYDYIEDNGRCSNACDYTKNPKKYVVSDFGYLGGFYGGTSEAHLMKEIRARGPIPGNMIVPASFHYYKSGIFSAKALKTNSNKINKWRMVDNQIYFQKVEHSITLVGYGEENGVKYWIGMNTWGSSWGENGFFKILRGENESNIETMGDFFNIKVIDRN